MKGGMSRNVGELIECRNFSKGVDDVMKNICLITFLSISLLFLQACNDEVNTDTKMANTETVKGESKEAKKTDKANTSTKTVNKETVKEEGKETNKGDNKANNQEGIGSTVPSKTFLTKDEFNKMFKLDPEEKQYPNGKFQLKDGSIVNADYLMYGENDLFSYAMTIFYQGKLVHLQVETNKPVEEVFKGLGITPTKDVIVETKDWGDVLIHDITFDKTFEDSNIAVFPNEWD
jgi:hypothetical protein